MGRVGALAAALAIAGGRSRILARSRRNGALAVGWPCMESSAEAREGMTALLARHKARRYGGHGKLTMHARQFRLESNLRHSASREKIPVVA